MDESPSQSHPASAHSSSDVSDIDHLLALFQFLVEEATWPDTTQGEFLDYLSADVLEIGSSIRNLADSEFWTTAVLLGRPLHERSLFLWAAAIDPAFFDVYHQEMKVRMESDFRKGGRLLVGEARGVINKWEQKRAGTSGLLESNLRVWSTSSQLQHHSIGMSQLAAQNNEQRKAYAKNAAVTLRSACETLLVSLEITGRSNAELAAKGRQLLSSLLPPDGHSQGEISC